MNPDHNNANVNPSNPITIVTNSLTSPPLPHFPSSASANGSSFQHGVSSVLPPLPPHAAATYMIQQQQHQSQSHPLPYHHNSTSIALARNNGGEYLPDICLFCAF